MAVKTEDLELIITVGLPRSGKSTYIKENYSNKPGYKIFELDKYRLDITETVYDEDAEPAVWDIMRDDIKTELRDGNSVVIDECNPLILNLEFWLNAIWNSPSLRLIPIKVLYFNTPADVCISRTDPNNQPLINAIKRKASKLASPNMVQYWCYQNSITFISIPYNK